MLAATEEHKKDNNLNFASRKKHLFVYLPLKLHRQTWRTSEISSGTATKWRVNGMNDKERDRGTIPTTCSVVARYKLVQDGRPDSSSYPHSPACVPGLPFFWDAQIHRQ